MIFEQFAVVHCYGADSAISACIDKIRAECRVVYPELKEPKLKNHITSFPPLLAPLDEMRYMVIGIKTLNVLHGDVKSERNRVEVKSLDFFRNQDADALILKVKLSSEYEEFINFWRENLGKFTKWKFHPLGEKYTPHICIAEARGLYEKLAPRMADLEKLVQPINFFLPPPKVMMKIDRLGEVVWEEFDPLMGL